MTSRQVDYLLFLESSDHEDLYREVVDKLRDVKAV